MKSIVGDFEALKTDAEDVEVLLELFDESGDESIASEAADLLNVLASKIEKLETQSLLSGKYDAFDCIFTINAGAGGTDAQDWAQMLLRMYTRWMEKNHYTVELLEETAGDEAGIKSATLSVSGNLAYGYLSTENGIHRLVRQSPFNAGNKRQTSFAAVDVIPKLTADFSGVEIDSKDLKIDTFRASGAGGQHVNKTDSAVRITHLPTGLVAQSQNSRSQGANKDAALLILKSRLLTLMEKEHKDKVEELRGDSKDIAWGHQIRSYVFHPYKMVKDLRTNVETSNVGAVMDGELDAFIHAALRIAKVD